MSQYLIIADAATETELYEGGMNTVRELCNLCGDDAPGLFEDHDLFGFDHSESYDPKNDGVHIYFPPKSEVLADLDILLTRLQRAPADERVGALLPVDHIRIFKQLRAKVADLPEGRVTSYVWF